MTLQLKDALSLAHGMAILGESHQCIGERETSVLEQLEMSVQAGIARETGPQTRVGELVPAVKSTPSAKEPEYGLYAVIAGLVALAGLNGAALAVFSSNISNAVGVIGTISSPIVAMVSAYFGIKVGSQTGSAGVAAAEVARQKAEAETKALLGSMTPEQAKPVMQSLGIPASS